MQKLEEQMNDDNIDAEDCSKFVNFSSQIDWRIQESIETIRFRFVSKGWSKTARGGGSRDVNGNDDVGEDDEDLFGDFEDLETGQKYESHEAGGTGTNDMIRMDDESAVEERRLKKLALRAKFDSQYPFVTSSLFPFPSTPPRHLSFIIKYFLCPNYDGITLGMFCCCPCNLFYDLNFYVHMVGRIPPMRMRTRLLNQTRSLIGVKLMEMGTMIR